MATECVYLSDDQPSKEDHHQKLGRPTKYYTDGWGAYERHLDPKQHRVGKDKTQKIENKHINLRTRIKRLMRRTICFSKTERGCTIWWLDCSSTAMNLVVHCDCRINSSETPSRRE